MLLEILKKDNVAGADELLRKTASYFLENCRTANFAFASETKDFIRRAGLELIQAQPRMAPLFNLVNNLFLNCDQHTDLQSLIETTRSIIKEFLDRCQSAREEIIAVISPLIRENITVTTYSRSSLVIYVLKNLAREKKFNVCLTESRPMFEGRKAALELVEAGVPVTLMVDAAMRECVVLCDLILVGADSFTDEHVVNKIGTGALVLLAREAGKPVYVVCTTQKYLPQGVKMLDEPQHDADEVWAERTGSISIQNKYFEKVNTGLFSGMITEKGLLKTDRLPRMAGMTIHPWLKG
ncbi:hypothetical protein JXQ31_16130 [candidate division KSB1 bacterium]|nr:hypothetical protein [candidate division KSB1 bacterium]